MTSIPRSTDIRISAETRTSRDDLEVSSSAFMQRPSLARVSNAKCKRDVVDKSQFTGHRRLIMKHVKYQSLAD